MSKKEIIKKGVELYNKHFPNDKHITEKTGSSPIHLPANENSSEENNMDQKLLW